MTPGDLTIVCDPTVVEGSDLEVRAERHTVPPADLWALCLATDRRQIRLRRVPPAALACRLDDDGVLRLSFPADVRSISLAIEAGEVGHSEWQFWIDDGGPWPHAHRKSAA